MGRWDNTRKKAHKVYGSECVKCGSTENLSVHHLKARSLFPDDAYDIKNLRILCLECHRAYHMTHDLNCGKRAFNKWIRGV